ncbi:MAG: hypothetical protein C0506_14085 [Anaerolinea sp.]|nr:hypothetical protein [Anaerolinea sp.]
MAVATIALVVVTYWYVKVTQIMANATSAMTAETRRQYAENNRPRIRLAFQYPQEILVTLVVENVGTEEALDLRLETEPALRGFNERESVTDHPLFAEGAKSFPPSFRVEYVIGIYPEFVGEHAPPTTYQVRASYVSKDGRHFKDEILLDLRFVSGSRATRQDPQESMAESLKKLANRLEAAKPLGSNGILIATPRDVEATEASWRRKRRNREQQRRRSAADDPPTGEDGTTDSDPSSAAG